VVVVVKGHEIKSEGNEGVHGKGHDEDQTKTITTTLQPPPSPPQLQPPPQPPCNHPLQPPPPQLPH